MQKLRLYCEDPLCEPTRAHPSDAGLDLRASETIHFGPNEIQKVNTGIHIEIAYGFVGLIFPRSGLATKEGITLANTVGVIDSDYRGPIICALHSKFTYTINKYDRIAQLLVVPIALPTVELVGSLEQLSNTKRGEGGFGHTGN